MKLLVYHHLFDDNEIYNLDDDDSDWMSILEMASEFVVLNPADGRKVTCRHVEQGNGKYWYGCARNGRIYLGKTKDITLRRIYFRLFEYSYRY